MRRRVPLVAILRAHLTSLVRPAAVFRRERLRTNIQRQLATPLKRGVQAWNKGQNDQALRYFSEAVQLDPDSVEARTDLGAVYAKTGRAEEALKQYEQALALDPNLAGVHSNIAAALVMLSRWEEAEQAARRALQLDPRSIDADYMLGIALMKQGKITAETAAHLAIAAKKYPRTRAYLADVQAQLAVVNGTK